MAGNLWAAFRLLLVSALLLGAGGQPAGEEYYFGIDLNGVLFGYARLVVSPLAAGARTLTRLEHEMVVRGTLLRAPVDNRMVKDNLVEGIFGRHAWNEVYMGDAGWIPIDATIGEADYVDSGHVRLGVVQPTGSGIDVRRIEILGHRTSAPKGSATRGR